MLHLCLDDELTSDTYPILPCARALRAGGRRCPDGCEGHYEWGIENASEVLVALPWFPGAEKWRGWNDRAHSCRAESASLSVRLYRDDVSFKDADGDPVTVFSVIENDTEEGLYVVLLRSAGRAQEFYDDCVAWIEDDCCCPG